MSCWLTIPSCVVTILRLAEGHLTEAEFADWMRMDPAVVKD